MAKDGKTEKATPGRRKEQREKGNLARSQDTSNFLTLASLAVIVFFYAKPMVLELANLVDSLLEMTKIGTTPKQLIFEGVKHSAKLLIPIVIIGTFFHVLNYVLQVKFLFSFKIIKPDFKRINPVGYFKNLFSRKKVIDLTKYMILLVVLGYIAFTVLNGKINEVADTIWLPWNETVIVIYEVFKSSFGYLLVFLLIISAVDYVYQKWEHEESIKMKKDEVKDERKKSEGNPETKGRQREFMREILKNNIIENMREGTVVINNPTHISVALRYQKGRDNVPVVIAKGEEEMALFIRSLAKENKIPMVENKPLARSLYYNIEVGNEIDENFYEAVVGVMRYLIETKQLEM